MIYNIKLKYNTRFFKLRNAAYYMRLQPFRRYQRPIYKIVVVNKNNRIVYTLGYYNPFKINFRTTYRAKTKVDFVAKIISLDRRNTIAWLCLGVIPSTFLCYILNDMGLFKTQLLTDKSKYLDTNFNYLRFEAYKLMPFFFDELKFNTINNNRCYNNHNYTNYK